MKEPWFDIPVQRKVTRVCANPLCHKALSKLNKQDLCFCCHDRQMAEMRGGVYGRRVSRIFTR